MFQNLVWQKDRMLLNGLVFRLQHYKNDDWEMGPDHFLFYKTKPLIDQYARFMSLKRNFSARNILELGVFDGGSAVFWFEIFRPSKLVGVDITKGKDSEYFQRYVAANDLNEKIKIYWGTDQSDAKRLRDIANSDFSGSLDLVFDDASHAYEPTKSSFETLFPFLRPGGLYIIEDWAWGHWEDFHGPASPFAKATEPTKLIFELVEATGSAISQAAGNSTVLLPSLSIFQGFAVIERGAVDLPKGGEFKLEDYICRRSKASAGHNFRTDVGAWFSRKYLGSR